MSMLRFCCAALVLFFALPAAGGAESEAVEWLRSYLQIDTSNPPGGEHRSAGLLRRILHREGIATQLVVSPEGRVNLLARLSAESPTRGALALLHHMDVVPAGDGWSVDPFSAHRSGDTLWGRGAVDDKSLGIAHLAAFIELKRRGARLTRDVLFLAVADEESGGRAGAAWLLASRPGELGEISAVLGEGGHNRAYRDKLAWWGIEVAQKRPLWLRATARGRGGHGSILNLHTAPHRLIRALDRLLERPLDLRVSPQVREYFVRIEPYESAAFRTMLSELDEIVADEAAGHRLLPGLPSYLADSLQINVLAAGSRINTAPAGAEALIDMRLLPDTDADALLEELRRLAGDEVEIEVLLSSPPTEASPTDHPLYLCLADALASEAPVIPAFIPGVTDSRHFRARGIPAYGFSPFVLDPLDLQGIHGTDERISIRAFERGVETMIRVVRRCATG